MFFAITGSAEGILTALILAAGKVLDPASSVTAGLALKVGLAAGLPEVVVFFAAEFSRQKGDLARMERELNLTTHGKLAAGRLGRLALQESLSAALLSSVCSFLGATLPLLLASVVPGPKWLSILAALASLALLGFGIGFVLSGCKTCWALVLACAGLALAVLGAYLKVV